MTIYTPLPYVYICTHKKTNQFYIGYREANKIPSFLDLPEYKTSSKKVKPYFDEFDWIIVKEFQTGEEAYDFEQQLIYENWQNQLLLNETCHYGKLKFRNTEKYHHTEDTKQRLSKSHTGKTLSNETKKKMSLVRTGKIFTEETKQKISKSKKGKIASLQAKQKMSAAKKGSLWYNNGIQNKRTKVIPEGSEWVRGRI